MLGAEAFAVSVLVVCLTVIILRVFDLRAERKDLADGLTVLQAGHEAHSKRLDTIEHAHKDLTTKVANASANAALRGGR